MYIHVYIYIYIYIYIYMYIVHVHYNLFSSVPKDVYFDKQAADADQKKEEAIQKQPKQRNSVYMYTLVLHSGTYG